MVGQKMPFLDATLLLLGQPAEHLAQMLAQTPVQHLAPAFRDKNNVVLALPLGVAYALILVHPGLSLKCAWRLTSRSFLDGLPQMSNCYCLPGRAGGTPCWISNLPVASTTEPSFRGRWHCHVCL